MNFWQAGRIRLRAIEPGDAETFFRWNQDSERSRYLDFVWPPQSLASVQEWTLAQSKKKLEQDNFAWVIETLDGTPLGTIVTHDCNARDGVFSYGLDIAAEHRRQGYASAAIRLVLRYYFTHLRYQKVTVQVHSDNLASLRLHEALGFQREGCLRRACFQNGRYLDNICFGMTVEEFTASALSKE